jgi:hypothetical protein
MRHTSEEKRYTNEEVADWARACTSWTMGAHIIPHACDTTSSVFRNLFPDWDQNLVDAAGNGIPMCKPFEKAFDTHRWCFVFHDDCWRVFIADPNLKDTIKWSNADSQETRAPKNLTWERINGTPVKMPSVISRRAVWFHSFVACQKHGRPVPPMPDEIYLSQNSPEKVHVWLDDLRRVG